MSTTGAGGDVPPRAGDDLGVRPVFHGGLPRDPRLGFEQQPVDPVRGARWGRVSPPGVQDRPAGGVGVGAGGRACRGVGGGVECGRVGRGGGLGWLYFWVGLPIHLWRTGLFAFVVASAGAGLLLGFCERFHRRPGAAGWCGLAAAATGLLFAHVTAPLLVLGGGARRSTSPARRHGGAGTRRPSGGRGRGRGQPVLAGAALAVPRHPDRIRAVHAERLAAVPARFLWARPVPRTARPGLPGAEHRGARVVVVRRGSASGGGVRRLDRGPDGDSDGRGLLGPARGTSNRSGSSPLSTSCRRSPRARRWCGGRAACASVRGRTAGRVAGRGRLGGRLARVRGGQSPGSSGTAPGPWPNTARSSSGSPPR